MQTFIEMVRNKTALKTVSVDSVWIVYDTLFCEVSFTWRSCALALRESASQSRLLSVAYM